MSRKKTAIDDNIIPMPSEKTKVYIIGIGIRKIVQLNGARVTKKTSKKARNEKSPENACRKR